MKSRLFFALLATLSAPIARAQLPPLPGGETPAELGALAQPYDSAVARLAAARAPRANAARVAYAAAIDAAQRDATARGELEAVLAAKAARDRLDRALTPEERKALPPALAPARVKYEQAQAALAAQERQEELALLRPHLAALEALQKRLTQQNNLAAALQVKARRESLETRFAELGWSGSAPPTTAASTSSAARSAGGLAPTLPAPPAIALAASLQARRAAEGVAEGAVPFSCPRGDGRTGANGLLVKADGGVPKAGSSFALRYTRGGTANGVQLIHPMGRGHAIATIEKNTVGLTTPATWGEIGHTGGGGGKRARRTKDFDTIFPLKDDEEYELVSRLSAGGQWELTVNGRLVATGHAGNGEAFALEKPKAKEPGEKAAPAFKSTTAGLELPLAWQPGWFGVIIGPMDRGTNRCRDVRFFPGVVDPARLPK